MEPLALPAPNIENFSWPQLDTANLDVQLGAAISPSVIWLAFLLTAVFAILITIILKWHWNRYALNTKTEKKMTVIYLTVLAMLTALLVAAIFHYQGLA